MKRAFVSTLMLAILSGISLSPTAAAAAQSVCGKRADIIRQLGEQYGETRRLLGIAQGKGVVELYASDATGSWTIVVTSPQGLTCLIAAGEAFQVDPVAATGKPA